MPAHQARSEGLGLVPLTPNHEPAQHSLYSDELVALLTDDERRRHVWNIALTGNYGSGKSSVLAGVRSRLDTNRRARVVQISLSSLSDVGVSPASSSKGNPLDPKGLTNYIQKEIVKQLLYQVRPSKVPGSRFRRLSRVSKGHSALVALLLGAVLAGVLWLTGWGEQLNLPPEMEWLRPARFALVGTGAAALAFITQLLFANRWRFEKIGTSSASISLTTSDKSDTYFDEYLDEIVYFFEQTRRDVVIIEDLDRFEDPSIYASLRELNTLLNAAGQLRARPVHFIYAVRDSIFEDLEEQRLRREEQRLRQDEPKEEPENPDEHHGVWQAEKRLAEPATQRTKFFDLVIPIVPFITHRSSTELLTRLMENVDPKVSPDAIRIVAKHITDMRLLRNIANEYQVFRSRVLGPNTPNGLREDQLFALLAYKNTHLEDFESLQVSDSNLDRIYRRSRGIISAGLASLALQDEALATASSPSSVTVSRAELLGAELQALVERWLRNMGHQPHTGSYLLGGVPVATTELTTVEFWRRVIDANEQVTVQESLGGTAFNLDSASIRADLGSVVPTSWTQTSGADHSDDVERIRNAQRWLRAADIGDLVAPGAALTDIDHKAFEAWILELVDDDPLVVDLIRAKLLDRNYPLYASQFYGITASAIAVTYDFQHVKSENPDFTFHLSPGEVQAVLSLGGPRVFESVGLFNTSIYDNLLPSDDRLDDNLRLLASNGPEAAGFLDTYLQQGGRTLDLARRLAQFWPGIFQFAEAALNDKPNQLREFVLAAFRGVDPTLDYEVSDRVREIIASEGGAGDARGEWRTNPSRPVAALRSLGIELNSLDGFSDDATEAVVSARVYKVNEANLRTVADGADLSLDNFIARHDGTFDHVMQHLDEYLRVLDDTDGVSVTDQSEIVDVLTAVAHSRPGRSGDIETRIAPELTVESLQEVPNVILEVLALGRRFAFTFQNLETYIEARDIDTPLIEYLTDQHGLTVPEETPPERRAWLATKILEQSDIPIPARLEHAGALVTVVAPSLALTAEPELVSALVKAGMLLETVDSYQGLSRSSQAQLAFLEAASNANELFMSLIVSPAVAALVLDSALVDRRLKTMIADTLPSNTAWQSPEVYEAIGKWIRRDPHPLILETGRLILGLEVSTESRAAALNSVVGQLSVDEIVSYTAAVGEPHSRLLERSFSYVDVPIDPDFTNVLRALQENEHGPVSSWDSLDDVTLRVRMRHPLSGDNQ